MREIKVPAELFDNVADNLIENAFNKAADTNPLEVRVTLSALAGGTLAVCDNGSAIAKNLAKQLFEGPVSSQSGYGVGLYQSGRLARQLGYTLELTTNRRGSVCFSLSRRASDASAIDHRSVA
jgi:sensor histidine kinase regulating citrate/malate metabolism